MAISHVCLECGFDLAQVRARRDAEYGLWIVRCPRCATCCARNPNLIGRTWHSILRVDIALSILVVQVPIAFGLLAAGVGAISGVAWMLDELVRRGRWDPGHTAMAAALIGAALVTGTWLTACVGHVDRRRLWIGWWAAITVAGTVFGWNAMFANAIELTVHSAAPEQWFWVTIGSLIFTAAATAAFLSVALLGVVPGRWLRLLHSRFRSRRWRWRRRRRQRFKGRL